MGILQEAGVLKGKFGDTKNLVLAIRKYILDHAASLSGEARSEPKSIIESRFTPAQEAFDKGMLSCGTMSNIAAEMLRHNGYKVKFIHGENRTSVDHAWISVFEPESKKWVEYDLTRPEADMLATHTKKLETDSWEEIKDQIYSDHKTMIERRKERGIQKQA